MGSSEEFYNITLTTPNINETMTNKTIFIWMKLPVDEELYIVDFHSKSNQQKIHSIATFLCAKPYSNESFWFDNQPCAHMDISMKVYDWYYNVPPLQWPKDAGFPVGKNTPYRYAVVRVQYFEYNINDIYNEQITMIRKKPKYLIGSYQIVANAPSFSCEYHSNPVQIFSTAVYTNHLGRSASLYRVRNKKAELIIKGNLHWPSTYYQLKQSFDIQKNDYFIGSCNYDDQNLTPQDYKTRDIMCDIKILFFVNKDAEIHEDICWNNEHHEIVEKFLPKDASNPPKTLFDINPIYPKLTPDEWENMMINSSSKPIASSTKDTLHFEEHEHEFSIFMFIWLLALFIGFTTLSLILIQFIRRRKYTIIAQNHVSPIIVGGEGSSISRWLTTRRFQQQDQDGILREENTPLRQIHRWASESESDMSDSEVVNTSDFRTVLLRS